MAQVRKHGLFYGRTKTKQLTKLQSELMSTMLPEISASSAGEIGSLCSGWDSVFLEIGFGSGEHIAQLAIANPDCLYLGCEMFVNGIASLLSKINSKNIKNVKVLQMEAQGVISGLKDNSLDGIFLLFPDPWPKRRHEKRRFVQVEMALEMHRVLRPGGFLRTATDSPEYIAWLFKVFSEKEIASRFASEICTRDSRPSEKYWPKTRYEAKAAGTDVIYATYNKLESGSLDGHLN